VARPLALIAIPVLLASAGGCVARDPVVVGQCREEAETAAVLTARDDKSQQTVHNDVHNRCMRRGRPDHR
jgi:hypothetical protein